MNMMISYQELVRTFPSERAVIANELLQYIENNELGKGYFAQSLSDKILNNKVKFETPEYIKNAILWVCQDGEA
ncbi:hypothetical protein RQP58_18705 [Enterobacter asburiae]|uniref:hypothetical protein n=1 Tax=Enterobacter asburiae TaxID=61645 RepID=UPI0028E43014|nr:hypothetical protein [Enterobacter asburiae]WNS32374.1 hypothetical protein RQP58_18705 [Enterobacter asburiae]